MKVSKIVAVAVIAGAAAAGTAAPALASARTPFLVLVNGNVDVTYQNLTVGQVVYCGGIAHTVTNVHGHAVRFVPALSGPSGTRFLCTT